MNILNATGHIRLFLGLIVASAVSLPCLAASAATLYVADLSGGINKISSTGVVTPFATGPSSFTAIAFDGSGNLFEAVGTGDINQISSTGVITPFATGFSFPTAIAFDGSGNLFVAGTGINKISSTGVITPFVTGFFPTAIAFDGSGNLFAADGAGNINKISSTGVVTPFVTGLSSYSSIAFDGSGNLIAADFAGGINKISSTGVVTPFVTGLTFRAIAIDSSDNIFAASNNTISKISSTGAVNPFAAITTSASPISSIAFAPDTVPTPPPSSNSVPEPFTIIGTLIGGTAAFQLRRKLKSTTKV